MKQITEESVNAFLNRRGFNRQNMKVAILDNKCYLLLHNNIIAILHPDNTLMISNAGWQSNTTKERLNGVIRLSGINIEPIYQKNWQWYLNGEEWNGELIAIN